MTIEDLLTGTERRRLKAQRLLGLAESLLTDECEQIVRGHVKDALSEFEKLLEADLTKRHQYDSP